MVILEENEILGEKVKNFQESDDISATMLFNTEAKQTFDKIKKSMDDLVSASQEGTGKLQRDYRWHNRLILWGVILITFWQLVVKTVH